LDVFFLDLLQLLFYQQKLLVGLISNLLLLLLIHILFFLYRLKSVLDALYISI
jgi:hypothetical protein